MQKSSHRFSALRAVQKSSVPTQFFTMRGSSSVFVQVTAAPALIVKNMAMIRGRLRDGTFYSAHILKSRPLRCGRTSLCQRSPACGSPLRMRQRS